MSKILVNSSPYRSSFTIHARRERSQQERVKIEGQNLRFDLNPYLVMVGLFILAVILSGLSLMHFNTVATQGYELKKLEIAYKELQSQSDIQNLYLAKAQSMGTILESSRLDRMRKPAQMQFIYKDNVIAQAP